MKKINIKELSNQDLDLAIEKYENKVSYIRGKVEYHLKKDDNKKVEHNKQRLIAFENRLTALLNEKEKRDDAP